MSMYALRFIRHRRSVLARLKTLGFTVWFGSDNCYRVAAKDGTALEAADLRRKLVAQANALADKIVDADTIPKTVEIKIDTSSVHMGVVEVRGSVRIDSIRYFFEATTGDDGPHVDLFQFDKVGRLPNDDNRVKAVAGSLVLAEALTPPDA